MIIKHASPKIFTVKERTVYKTEITTVLKKDDTPPPKKIKRKINTDKTKQKRRKIRKTLIEC